MTLIRGVVKPLCCLGTVLLLLAALSSCAPAVPPPGQFSTPATGTLMPAGHEEAVQVNWGPDQSGLLFVNQTDRVLQVVVNNTKTTIPVGQEFLFLLPPGAYDFHVYESDTVMHVHTEKLEPAKLRYVYWSWATG